MPNFVHLHCHSEYSLLDGLSRVRDMVDRAKQLGMPALALTDHGALYGAVDFYVTAKAAGLKPILGVETYVAKRSRLDRDGRLDQKPWHLVLLVKDLEGYGNLVKLITAAHLEGYYYRPRIDKDLLRQHARGLIALSACLQGEVASAIRSGDLEGACGIAREHEEIFGRGSYFLELMNHGLSEEEVVRSGIRVDEMTVSFDLAGKRALVTGASRGIGRAIAVALARAGADVAVTSRTGDAGDPVAREIVTLGRRGLSLLLDVRHLVSIRACFARLDQEWGALDVLVNNAGTNVARGIFEVEEEDWDLVVDTNLKGLFFVTQAAARRMVDAKREGRIVNIASTYGLVANLERVSYSAAKGGVVNLTRALALELAPYRISVNGVAPTFVPTELTAGLAKDESYMAMIRKNIPLGEVAMPEDVASAVVFLASPAASLITGHTLLVDGGWTAV